MLFFEVSLEEQLRCEADAQLRASTRCSSLLQGTLATPVFQVAMDFVAVSLQCWF